MLPLLLTLSSASDLCEACQSLAARLRSALLTLPSRAPSLWNSYLASLDRSPTRLLVRNGTLEARLHDTWVEFDGPPPDLFTRMYGCHDPESLIDYPNTVIHRSGEPLATHQHIVMPGDGSGAPLWDTFPGTQGPFESLASDRISWTSVWAHLQRASQHGDVSFTLPSFGSSSWANRDIIDHTHHSGGPSLTHDVDALFRHVRNVVCYKGNASTFATQALFADTASLHATGRNYTTQALLDEGVNVGFPPHSARGRNGTAILGTSGSAGALSVPLSTLLSPLASLLSDPALVCRSLSLCRTDDGPRGDVLQGLLSLAMRAVLDNA